METWRLVLHFPVFNIQQGSELLECSSIFCKNSKATKSLNLLWKSCSFWQRYFRIIISHIFCLQKQKCWLSIFIYSYSSSHTIHLVITQFISFSMEGVFYEKTFSTWECKNCKVSREVHFCAWHTTINVSNAKQVSQSMLIFIRRYLFAEKQRLCCWKLLTACTPTFNYSEYLKAEQRTYQRHAYLCQPQKLIRTNLSDSCQ